MDKKHKRVSVFNPFLGEDIEVDEGISKLLQVLWSLEIEATPHSEVRSGFIEIIFPCLEDYEGFLTGLTIVNYDFFWDEIIGSENWSTDIYPYNSNEKVDENNPGNP